MLTYRPGTPQDAYPAYRVFRLAIQVVYYQHRIIETLEPFDEATIRSDWENWRSLYEHLERSAERFCVVEQDGQMAGYARTILRDGVRELTELFLHPDLHAGGVGRELLRRVFPAEGASHRTIIATLDPRAVALYMQNGMAAWHPLYTFYRRPERVAWRSDLEFAPLPPGPDWLVQLAAIDRQVLGHTRDVDHAWLLSDREGVACLRDGRLVGYAYLGRVYNGPFALLDGADFPAVLAYAETRAAELGLDDFAVDAPLINGHAVRWLLERKYRMGQFVAYHMSDSRLGGFENYLYTAPDFFL